VENLVQALARDVFLLGLNRLERAGHRLLFHVHDEAIVEAPQGTAPAAIAALLTEPPEWAKDLPLASDSEVSVYYKK
jgi:DNA polymerase